MTDHSMLVTIKMRKCNSTRLFMVVMHSHCSSIWMGRTNLEDVSAKEFVMNCQEGNIKDYFPKALAKDCSFLKEITGGNWLKISHKLLTESICFYHQIEEL